MTDNNRILTVKAEGLISKGAQAGTYVAMASDLGITASTPFPRIIAVEAVTGQIVEFAYSSAPRNHRGDEITAVLYVQRVTRATLKKLNTLIVFND